ncbi:MAG: DNA polymerase III subunit beta [Pseudomonadota bacterium]|uniref:Beta sliding clamp n=1 Tax=Candidatus Desulfatibia profunda TaxID=2841695 RepID=A0A8J6NWU9_9BACT|nr:DNA polymerase III subunit beta [Candidatus Desulfatibia profunda]MBL7180008.1 DNA polymerase III subunit beta [Desulfobacterales bacterium]
MKLKVKKDDILDILSKIQGLAGRKSNLAITANVLVRATNEGVTFVVTDLETGFKGLYPAIIETEGVIAINARKFYEIVREFPVDEIQVNEIENHWIKIGDTNVEYNIVGMNPEDFPETPHIERIDFFQINSSAFKKMIDKTVIITGAADERRAHITGIYFEIIKKENQNLIRMVSTDGNRLSTVDYSYSKESDLPAGAGVLIPKKGLQEVMKFLDSEGIVQIGFKNNNFIIKKDTETIIIRLLEGDFPEYQDIIKKSDGNIINLDRQLFLKMLKRMSILSSEEYKSVIFNFTTNKLIITTTNPDIGESKEEMGIDYKGVSFEVAFNPRYFIETLNVIEQDKVNLNIINEERPCLIQGENNDTYLSVIMPMKI